MLIKYLTFKIVKGVSLLDQIRRLKPVEFEFWKETILHIVGDTTLISSRSRDAICKRLNISVSTYWRRIEKLVELKLMVKESHGIYELNKSWVRMLTIDTEDESKKKQVKADTQHPTNSRF